MASVATLRGWKLTEQELALEGGHLVQTARVMAKRHRDAVGPWLAYLPVLDR